MFVEKLIPKAKLVLADNYDQAVASVQNDQAVAMVADYPICMVSVYRYPDAGFITLGKPISYEPIGVALPANDPLLVNWVQNSLNFIEKSGSLRVSYSGGSRILRGSVGCHEEFTTAFSESTSTTRSI
jgi:polar amino acid transport system substrate-binding protein